MRIMQALRSALVVLAAGLAFPSQATAASFTFNDPNCAAFTLSGTGGSYTIACTSLVCSLTATPATQLPNQSVALAANCVTPITAATWAVSGTGCTQPAPGTLGNATVTENGIRTCTYTVNASDGTNTGQGNVTVVWANTPPPAPTNCTISRTPVDGNLTTAGGAISASVTCTGGGPANTWTWRKNGTNYATTAGINDSLPANALTTPVTYTYDVVACNGPSCAAMVTTTFTVAGTAPPSMCTQYQNVVNFDLPWGGYLDTHTLSPISFLANGVMVGKFTVPATWPTKTSTGTASAVEFIDAGTYRTFTLSTQACDFRTSIDSTGVSGPLWRVVDQRPSVWFTVGGSVWYAAKLTAGQTYYVNIRNYDNAGNLTCFTGTCNMRITLSTPQ